MRFNIQSGGLIWFPPYMVWLVSCMKGYDSSIIILKNGHNLGSDYYFLMKLSGFLHDGLEIMLKKFQNDSS